MAKSTALPSMRRIAESKLGDVERHLESLGEWKGTVTHSQVLAMTYINTARTQGGIILPDSAVQEDQYQGKAFLIIDMGPLAFKDDNIAKFGGIRPTLQTWFMARPSDGLEFYYNGNTLRLFQDVDIRLIDINPRDFY